MRYLSYIWYVLIYQPLLKLYLKSDSHVSFDGFKLKIFKGVFHPKLFFSTKYFYSFLEKKNFKDVNFLEIGCGSGILSLLAYRKGAKVTSLDVDERAVKNTKLNFERNFNNLFNVTILQSDLFRNLPLQAFDMVVINPPYYFRKIEIENQRAWYCGQNGEFFEDLFLNLSGYIHQNTKVYMILEENCEIDRIKSIAGKNKIEFILVDERLIKWERNFIFSLISQER